MGADYPSFNILLFYVLLTCSSSPLYFKLLVTGYHDYILVILVSGLCFLVLLCNNQQSKVFKNGSSHCGAAEMNPTSIYEDGSAIPGLAQCVWDLALP